MIITKELCSKCKGRNFCGLKYCPILNQFNAVKIEKDQIEGSNVDVFVGRYNYPNVNVGIINVPETETKFAEFFSNNKEWINQKLSIREIITLRSNTLMNYKNNDVNLVKKDIFNDLALSNKPVYLSVSLQSRPIIKLKSFNMLDPFGARARFQKIELQDNPKIPSKIENFVNEPAKDALVSLSKRFDENYLRKVFSIGALGIKKKMVPTRWSITAIDDMLAKDMIDKIRLYETIENYEVFFSSLYGNYFIILLIPNPFMYELFEIYTERKELKLAKAEHDYELYQGRKEYAKITAGGYYASRLAVVEYLQKNKKQASAIVFRFITPEYEFPLGVWVVREAVRKTMNHKIRTFERLDDSIEFIQGIAKRNFLMDLSSIIKESQLINLNKQKKITDY
ncbi:MAG: hypothetical protein QXS41_02355 [Candidatus Woesearchaeota archaeon]